MLLSNLITIAQVQNIRLPAIKQILVTYPNVIAGGFTVVPGDGTTHFGIATTDKPPPCTAGYGTTNKRSPADTTLRTPNLNAYCAAPSRSGMNVRGAQNGPRPGGERPFPANGFSAVQGGGGAHAASSSAPGSGAGTTAQPSSTGGGPGAGDTAVLGDYNPESGNVITADGRRLTIGSTAGAQQVFGDNSWQLLLLGPMTG